MSRIQKISKQIQSSISFSCRKHRSPKFQTIAFLLKESSKSKKRKRKDNIPKGQKNSPDQTNRSRPLNFRSRRRNPTRVDSVVFPPRRAQRTPTRGGKHEGNFESEALFFPAVRERNWCSFFYVRTYVRYVRESRHEELTRFSTLRRNVLANRVAEISVSREESLLHSIGVFFRSRRGSWHQIAKSIEYIRRDGVQANSSE